MSDVPPSLDDLDFAILAHLQEDGRRSFTDMADALGVSIGTVRNRVGRLLRARTLHVIGRADPHHVGFRAPANLRLQVRPSHELGRVAERVAALPEASYVALVSGEYDLEADVMCRDLDHLTELVTRQVQPLPGVVRVRTDLILRIVKYGQPDLALVTGAESGA